MAVPSRTRLYSGSDRPAWRMNQTGVYGTGSPRHARRKGEFVAGWFTESILPYPIAAAANHPGDTPGEIRRNQTRTCQDQDEFRIYRTVFCQQIVERAVKIKV
jgi:hypothetical protein